MDARDFVPMTQDQVADRLGLSRGQVKKAEHAAIGKIAAFLRGDLDVLLYATLLGIDTDDREWGRP